MTDRTPSTATLFVRSRGGWGAAIAYLLVAAVAASVSGMTLVEVPLSTERAAAGVALTSCVTGLAAFVVLLPRTAGMERRSPSMPLQWWRLGWAVGVVAVPVVVVGVAVTVGGADGGGWVTLWFARNLLFVTGVAMVTLGVVDGTFAWAPVTAYVLLCWFAGTEDGTGTARWWAVPHLLPDSLPSWLVSGLVWAVGAALYARRRFA